MRPSFENEIDQFIERIDSMRLTLPIILNVISEHSEKAQDSFDSFVLENKIKREINGVEIHLVAPDKLTEYMELQKRKRSVDITKTLVPETFLVSLISQYDAYLGKLIRVIYNVRSELLSSSEREMTFSQISEFTTIADAKEFILGKEIESVLRESHIEQIKWFEKKLNMKLRKIIFLFKNS